MSTALARGRRHQTLQCDLVIEQRVTARQQHGVGRYTGQAQGEFDGFHTVDPQSPPFDDSFVPKLAQRAKRSVRDFELGQPLVAVKILGKVMHPDEIEPIHIQAAEAVLDRLQGSLSLNSRTPCGWRDRR
jgi:hypothetical protein